MLSWLTPKKNTVNHFYKKEKKLGQPVTIGHDADFFYVSDEVAEKMSQRQEKITTENSITME